MSGVSAEAAAKIVAAVAEDLRLHAQGPRVDFTALPPRIMAHAATLAALAAGLRMSSECMK